ncbi:vesicle-associated membrane protein 1 isoform X2 [Passer montanus]|uniref:vesicle-associated membrane protein 1 isoform X2 n=1 Tax=Passer montanus TaxID=9160 RepID=UPI0019600DE3|nr:vesicle-associated membrane protein 1 isoform X2 [Passer montanus]
MSDPAQQPAPGAPEGGAPEGGAPEGAAPGGGPPGAPPNLTSNRRLQQTQAQVQEVVDIMCVNVDKVLQRDEKLSELDDRADALQAGASVFESSAAKLKRKYWWKNCKMMIMMGVIGALVVVVIASSHQWWDLLSQLESNQMMVGKTDFLQTWTAASTLF